ncbi:MAG: hypothetical protein ABI267_09855 [Ginsengibacter sp.]
MINSLIEEVSDVAKTLGWSSYVFNNENIKGVSFAPGKSEPIFLTFNPDGRLLSPFNIICKNIYDGVQLDKELMFTTSTKTQYAGLDAHAAIIDFLKHLSKKYLKNFNLTDQGYYWETGDKKLLIKQFSRYEAAMDIFSEALKEMPAIPNETSESLVERLERLLKEKFGGGKDPG